MAEVVVKARPEILSVKKTGWPRQKPVRVHYSVVIDGKERVAFRKDYSPIKIRGAIESTKEFLRTWATQLAEYEKAKAEFEALKFDETFTV